VNRNDDAAASASIEVGSSASQGVEELIAVSASPDQFASDEAGEVVAGEKPVVSGGEKEEKYEPGAMEAPDDASVGRYEYEGA